MKKIKYVSLFFRMFFQATFVCLIAAQILGWMYATPANRGFFSIIPSLYQGYIFNQFDINTRIAGFFVSLIPLICQLLVIYYLIKLFYLYEKCEFFTSDNVRYIRNAGYALLLEQIAKPVSDFVLGFVLTSINPAGLHFAVIEITEKNIGVILTALVIILISWVMAEGCKMQADQQLII